MVLSRIPATLRAAAAVAAPFADNTARLR